MDLSSEQSINIQYNIVQYNSIQYNTNNSKHFITSVETQCEHRLFQVHLELKGSVSRRSERPLPVWIDDTDLGEPMQYKATSCMSRFQKNSVLHSLGKLRNMGAFLNFYAGHSTGWGHYREDTCTQVLGREVQAWISSAYCWHPIQNLQMFSDRL